MRGYFVRIIAYDVCTGELRASCKLVRGDDDDDDDGGFLVWRPASVPFRGLDVAMCGIRALGKGAAKRARRLAQTDNLVLFVLRSGGG